MKRSWVAVVFGVLLWTFCIPARTFADEPPPKPALIEKYKQLLEKQPAEGTALDRLWEIYSRHFSTKDLIADYRKRAEADPANGTLWTVLGLFEKKAGDLEGARRDLAKATEKSPDEMFAWQALADVEIAMGKPADAVKSLERAIALEKAPAILIPLYEKLGKAHSQNKDWPAATIAYEKISELDPENVQTHLQLATTYEEINIPNRSLDHYQAVIKIGEPFQKCTAYRHMGILLEKQEKFDEARAAYESGLQLTSYGNWMRQDLQRKLIQLYERQGKLSDLVAKLENQIKSEPGNLDPRWFLADLYAQQGDVDKQIEVLADAVKVASNVPELRKLLADAYRERNDYELAAAHYAELFKLEGRYLEHAVAACEMWVAARKQGEAIRFWRKILSEHGPDIEWYLTAAQFHSANKMPSDAEALFKKALEIDPHSTPVLLALGEHYFNQKLISDAVETWKKLVVPSDKEDVRLEQRSRLAELLRDHGLHSEASEVWEEIVQSQPENGRYRYEYGKQLVEMESFEQARVQFEKAMAIEKDLKFRLDILDALLDGLEKDRTREGGLNQYALEREKIQSGNPSRENLLMLCRVYLRQKKWSQAYTAMEGYLGTQPDDIPVLRELAEVASRIPGKHQRAEDAWNQLRKIDPAEERTYLRRLVRMKLDEKKSIEAVHYAKAIVELNPEIAASYVELADAYQQAHQPAAAIDQMRTAVQRDPQNFDYRRKLADMFQKFGRYDEAEAELTGMLQLSLEIPLRMSVLQDIMSLALKRSRLEDLSHKFRKKIEENPSDYFLYLANAEILRVMGDDRGSYEMLQASLKYTKDPSEALGRLVDIAYEENDLKEAIRYQQRLMRQMRDPGPSAFLKLAELQEEAEEAKAAEETWNLIARRFRDDQAVLRSVAEHYREKDADGQLRDIYDRIVGLDADDYQTWVEMAKLALKKDDKKRAIDCFNRVLALNPVRRTGTELILPSLQLVEDPSLWATNRNEPGGTTGRIARAQNPVTPAGSYRPPRNLSSRRLSRGGLFSNSPSIDLRKTPSSLEEARMIATAHLVQLLSPKELEAWEIKLEKEKRLRTAVKPEDVPKNQELLLFYVLTQKKEKALNLLAELSFAQPGNFNLRKFFLHAAAVWNRMDSVAKFLQEHTPNGLPPREGLYEVIDLLIGLGNSQEALNLAQQFIEKYPDIETHSELVHIFADRQRYGEAIQLARMALQKNPSGLQSMHYRSWLVEWLLLMGQSNEAAQLANEVIYRDVVDMISDQDSKVRVLRQVPFLFDEKELGKISAELPAYAEQHSTPIDKAATLGIFHTVLGDQPKATPYLSHVATLKSDNLDFLREASMWFEQQRYSEAARVFWDASKQALQRLPESDVVLAQIKDIERRQWEFLLQTGTEEEVNQHLEAMLKDPAADERVLQDLASQLRNYQYLEQSAYVWEWLINRSQDNASYKQQLIMVYQQTGDFDKAVQLWKAEINRLTKAFQGNENHPEVEKARMRLYDVYEQAGKLDELQGELEARLKKTPDEPELLKRLMRVYQQTNNEAAMANIREKLNRITRLQPSSTSTDVEYLIYHYQNQGNLRGALEEAERVYRREPAKRDVVLPILVNLYFQTDQQEKAMRMVRRLQAKQSSQQLSRIYQTIGYQLQSKAKWEEAIRIWQSAADASGSYQEAFQYQMRLVDIYINHLRDFNRADQELEQIENSITVNDAGQFTEAIQMRVLLEERRSTLQAYAEKLEKRIAQNPKDELCLWSLIHVYEKLSAPEKLSATVEKLIAVHSEDEMMLQQLANILKTNNQWKGVEKIHRQLLQRQPQNVFYYTELAGALLSDGRKDEAEKTLRRLERLNTTVNPYAQIAQFYLGRQMWPEANQYFEKALAESRGFRNLYVYQQYADSLVRQRQFEKAREIYKKIFSFPQGRQYYYNLFYLYREWGKIDQLMTDFGPEVKKMPFLMKQQLYQQIILAYKEQGDLQKAVRLYEEQPMRFTDPYLYQSIGEAYDNLQQYEKSAAAFQEAVARQPNNQQWVQSLAEAYWKRAQLIQKTGNLAEAEPLLVKACKLQPINQQYHFELAKLYETRSQYKKAIQVYRDLADVTLSATVKKSCEEQIQRLGKVAPGS